MSEHPFHPNTITAMRDSAVAMSSQKAHSPKTVRRLAKRMINALDRLAVLEAAAAETVNAEADNGYGEWPADWPTRPAPATQSDRLAALDRHPSDSPFALQRT